MTDIKELAQKAYEEVMKQSLRPQDKEHVTAVCECFLAAYLAEQEPVGVTDDYGNPMPFRNGQEEGSFPPRTKLFTAPPPLPEPAPHEQKPQLGAGRGGQTSQCEVKSSSKSHVCAAPSSEEVREMVERLRKLSAENPSPRDCIDEAADLIERLAARVTSLESQRP